MKIILGLLMFLVMSCTPKTNQTVILKVGNIAVDADEFSLRLIDESKPYSTIHLKDPEKTIFIKQKVLTDLTIESLLLNWALRSNIVVSQEDVEGKFKEKAGEYPDKSAFQETLNSLKLQKGILYKKLRIEVIKERLMSSFKGEPKFDEKELKQVYNQDQGSFMEPDKIKLQQIVVKNENEATIIHQSLKKGSDFGKLAREYSVGAEASNDGIVGWVEKGTLPAFDAAFQLPTKSISRPSKSAYGYHIFQVLEKKKRRKLSLDEVKEQMNMNSLVQQREQFFGKWLETELHAAGVSQNERAIAAISIDVKGS